MAPQRPAVSVAAASGPPGRPRRFQMVSAVSGMKGERCSPASRSASQVWPRTRPRAAMSRLANSHGFWLSMYWLAASSKLPDGLQGAVECEAAHGVRHPGVQRFGDLAKPPIAIGHRLAGGGDTAVKVAADHAQGTLQQVPQVVGQVGVQPGDQRLLAEVGVQPERHLAQQEVAEGVQAVLVRQVERREDPAAALGHLGLVHQPVAVDVEVLVERDARRLEHGRPVDAVGLQDVLADQVLRHRPESPEELPVRVAERADVVDQGVEPDVGDVLVVEGQRDAPLRRLRGREMQRSSSGSRRKPSTSFR